MALPGRSVWIEVQGCQNTENFERGIARQTAESTQALLRVAPEAIHTVGLTPLLPVPASLDFLHGTGKLGWVSGRGSEPDERPSIFHITSPFEGPTPAVTLEEQWPHWARRTGVRLVITLHDLIPLIFSEHYIDPNPIHMSRWLARVGMVRSADHILAVSDCTAADAVEHLGFDESRITVIDAGTSVQLASMVGSREEAAKILHGKFPGLRDGYLFYVGGADWRKNVAGLIKAYAQLPGATRERHQLVITYKLDPEARRSLERFARDLGIHGDQLLLTGFVPDRELSALYRCCGLFVFPSLYEGAGLPILEAMACGAPVVGSNVSSVPEILGDPRATFDPADPADVAACISRALDDDELERLRGVSAQRTSHYTWDRVAHKAIEGYERALAEPSHRDTPRRRRHRVAVFTPWPPEPSSAAGYSRQLVERLIHHADVDVIVAGGRDQDSYDRSLGSAVRLWPAGDFDWVHELRDFDRLLYVLGNSPLHRHALEGLIERPGVVLAHDVRFGALYESLQPSWGQNPVWLREKLHQMYGDRIPPADLRRAGRDRDLQERFGIYMSQEIQAHAEKLLVHSRYAADVLRMDRTPLTAGAETVVVSRAISEGAIMNDGGGRAAPNVISHAGGEHPEAIDLLMHGFAAIAEERPGAGLVLLGPLEEGAGARLAETASNLGLTDAVSTHGRLEGDAYRRALTSADVAVELRTSSDGEVSQGVCDCLAARLPTVVSSVGWLAELPEPAVLHLTRESSPGELADTIGRLIDDPGLRERIRASQDSYAAANSYERTAERYAELLEL
jgi:glycosyltransferase involved in cell wall biosynthesis